MIGIAEKLREMGFTGAINDVLLKYYQSKGAPFTQINDAENWWLEQLYTNKYVAKDDYYKDQGGKYQGILDDYLGYLFLNTSEFYAPLKTSLALTRGTGAPTFTRATTGTVVDHEGVIRTCLAGEARFTGARRVRNLIPTTSENFDTAAWGKLASGAGVAPIVTADQEVLPIPGVAFADKVVFNAPASGDSSSLHSSTFLTTVGNQYRSSIYIKAFGAGDVGKVLLTRQAAASSFTLITLTASYQRVGSLETAFATTASFDIVTIPLFGSSTGTISVLLAAGQVEDVTAQSVQTAGEYVSVGVLSSPYHGTGVDGVKCFDTTLAGVPISAATLKGYLSEPARTNHFKVSSAPATQTSASLSTGTYTLWMDGTGSIAVAGATATITGGGTANSSTAITFTVTVAGTVTYTVTGSPTRAQAENGATRTSYIDVPSTSAVTRNADVLTYPSAGNISDTAGTSYVAFSAQGITGANQQILARDTNGRFPYVNSFTDRTQLYDGTTQNNATAGPSFVNSTQKSAQSWGSGTKSISYAGTAIASSAYDGTQGTGAIAIGCNNAGTEHLGGNIKEVRISSTKYQDIVLRNVST